MDSIYKLTPRAECNECGYRLSRLADDELLESGVAPRSVDAGATIVPDKFICGLVRCLIDSERAAKPSANNKLFKPEKIKQYIKEVKMNILFVCKYNKFRSKVAENYFKKINKSKNIKVKSAGLIRGTTINEPIVAAAKEFGIKIKKRRKPKPLTTKLLRWQDLIIITADDVPRGLFSKKDRVVVWKIPDTDSLKNTYKINRAIKMIIKKINQLNKQLQKGELK